MYANGSTERHARPRRSRILVLLAGAVTVAVAATGSVHAGASARPASAVSQSSAASLTSTSLTSISRPSIRLSPEQQGIAELRARLSPELARLLDEMGRLVSLEELLRSGVLDQLERPAPLREMDDSYLTEDPAEGKPGDLSAKKGFDIDLFEQNIRDALDGATVGYAYSIWRDGDLDREDGVGNARVDPDDPVTAQSATKAMTIASVSKPVTAAAVLRLLEQKGISVDDPIGPWLPAEWQRGQGVEEITFRELMTHKSGLLQNFQAATGSTGGKSTGSWGSTRIAVGQDLGSKSYRYANMNFSIFRIMVPKIAFNVDLSARYDSPEPGATPEQYDSFTGMAFLAYLQPTLATAIVAASCADSAADATKLYPFPTNGASGWGPAPYILGCGGYGYYMSARGVGAFLARLRHTETLLSPASRALMFDGRLGLKGYGGAHGTYLGHDGVWAMSGGGMRGCAMMFPVNVEVALLVNNRGDAYPGGCDVVRQAFDAAWS